jgi:hypothetical protein
MVYPVIAQDNKLYVDPKAGVSIFHPVGSLGINYYYEILDITRQEKKVVEPRKLTLIPPGQNTEAVEERFITDEENLYRPYTIKIEWNCRYGKSDELCPDGDYLIRLYASKWGTRNLGRPIYEYTVVLDSISDPFEIEMATVEVSKNARGVFFARAVDEGGQPVKANRWEVTIYREADNEVAKIDSFDAPSRNGVIPFQFGWYDFSDLDQTGEYKYRIEITNRDRAGHYYSSKNSFSVLYTENNTVQAVSSEITSNALTSEYPPGEGFSMTLEMWGGVLAIQGFYDAGEKLFYFDFTYVNEVEDHVIENITIMAYDEKNVRLKKLTETGLSRIIWDGRDETGTFILTSNAAYRFYFTVYGTENETFTSVNTITTPLITEDRGEGEFYVTLPGFYFPGFETNIHKSDRFLQDNMQLIWKISNLLHRCLEKYECVIIRGYANYTSYPRNGVIKAADRRRMDNEKPLLFAYSKQRAEAVRDMLLLFKIPENKIRIEAMGPDNNTIDPNGPERHKNRRVEFYLKEKM